MKKGRKWNIGGNTKAPFPAAPCVVDIAGERKWGTRSVLREFASGQMRSSDERICSVCPARSVRMAHRCLLPKQQVTADAKQESRFGVLDGASECVVVLATV